MHMDGNKGWVSFGLTMRSVLLFVEFQEPKGDLCHCVQSTV